MSMYEMTTSKHKNKWFDFFKEAIVVKELAAILLTFDTASQGTNPQQ